MPALTVLHVPLDEGHCVGAPGASGASWGQRPRHGPAGKARCPKPRGAEPSAPKGPAAHALLMTRILDDIKPGRQFPTIGSASYSLMCISNH